MSQDSIAALADRLSAVKGPAAAAAPLCTLILYRHIVRTGGTSLRSSFCDARTPMRAAAVTWSPVGRPDSMPRGCQHKGMEAVKGRAVERFQTCALEGDVAAGAQGWAVEYHIANDGSRRFSGDARNVSDSRPEVRLDRAGAPLGELHWRWGSRARALTVLLLRGPSHGTKDARHTACCKQVLIVREPSSWFHSQWLNPEGPHMGWSHATRRNVMAAIQRLKPNPQWRALVGDSGDLQCPPEDIDCALGRFDVVGVTERLGEALQLVCSLAALRVCPTLRHLNSKQAANESASCSTCARHLLTALACNRSSTSSLSASAALSTGVGWRETAGLLRGPTRRGCCSSLRRCIWSSHRRPLGCPHARRPLLHFE